MGNSLLDFVMALVRDREAAARFAADPSGALSAAGLAGVTAADVNNLLPMVSDSIATTSPGFGMGAQTVSPGENVWASGAATAAFDAFEVHRPPVVPAVSSVDPGDRSPGQASVEIPEHELAHAVLPEITWSDDPGLGLGQTGVAQNDVAQNGASDQHDVHPGDDSPFDLF
jgi:hypothetical protein